MDYLARVSGSPGLLLLAATALILTVCLLFAIAVTATHRENGLRAAGLAVLIAVVATIVLWAAAFLLVGNPFLAIVPDTSAALPVQP